MMDETSRRIVEFNIVEVTEVSSSNAMENEGCIRTPNSPLSTNVPIRCLTTDRHTTITPSMKSEYSQIKRLNDVWHLSRWVTKKLSKKAKKRDCVKLMPRVQSISNHLRWSASTCNGDAAMLVENWISILHYIVNQHQWEGHQLFKACGHHTITKREAKSIKWLKPGSPAHVTLEEVVKNKKLIKDLAKRTEFHHTGELEQYHSLVHKYVPKRELFAYNGMIARTQLAILDHNHNVDRDQAIVKCGPNKEQKLFKIPCPKQRKNWVAKPIRGTKSHSYIETMMDKVISIGQGMTFDFHRITQAKCIAPTPRPAKEVVIQQY